MTDAPVGTPLLWALTIGAVMLLLVADFLITRRPHEVSMREAIGWSAFYIALPLAFGAWIWTSYGSQRGLEYYTGYLVEKSLSVDNLFVFLLLLAAFAVPRELQQRVLLIGVAGALVLRGVFIALGAQLISSFSWAFLLFGAILLATAVKVLRDAMSHEDASIDISQLRSVRLLRRFWPVTDTYVGTRMSVRVSDGRAEGGVAVSGGARGRAGRRALTPLALVAVAILATDVVFAIDSVPAVYGITGDPYLVFATNAFALLGLRALYFVLEGALTKLTHLGYGLSLILAFIGVKLVLHWAHGIWTWIPEVPTLLSLGVIVAILAVVTVTSLTIGAPAVTEPDRPDDAAHAEQSGMQNEMQDGMQDGTRTVRQDQPTEVPAGTRRN
ncbi:MAG: TerC/Alx family metal homeostasis membrane protein [Kineosporiaceae bacterium]|nr:TerC/Alx family metal homeostasis membrane protein [Kineosporiaceae bacterium]